MKSYISRKFPLETRTTDQILARRSEELSIGFHLRRGHRYFSKPVQKQDEFAEMVIHGGPRAAPFGLASLLLPAHLRSNRRPQFLGGSGASDVRSPRVSF